MLANNKMTTPHIEHEVTVKRAKPESPHYGYYHCVTCNKFVTWIDQSTYQLEKNKQLKDNVMWFGQYQGVPITDLPQEYLEWAILNVTHRNIKKLDEEYMRRINSLNEST